MPRPTPSANVLALRKLSGELRRKYPDLDPVAVGAAWWGLRYAAGMINTGKIYDNPIAAHTAAIHAVRTYRQKPITDKGRAVALRLVEEAALSL